MKTNTLQKIDYLVAAKIAKGDLEKADKILAWVEERTKTKPNLDSKEFYDLMQRYRFAPTGDQELVNECYNNIKEYLKR